MPQRYREALVEGCFLTKGLDGCVWLLPPAAYRRLDTMIVEQQQKGFDVQVRDLGRLFYSGSETRYDGQNRIPIPQALRRHARIGDDGQVVLVGARDYLELWSRPVWEARAPEIEQHAGELVTGRWAAR